jgi:hypothetical protein
VKDLAVNIECDAPDGTKKVVGVYFDFEAYLVLERKLGYGLERLMDELTAISPSATVTTLHAGMEGHRRAFGPSATPWTEADAKAFAFDFGIVDLRSKLIVALGTTMRRAKAGTEPGKGPPAPPAAT